MEKEKIVLLIQSYLDGSITEADQIILQEWTKYHSDNSNLLNHLVDEHWLREQLEQYHHMMPDDIDTTSLNISNQIIGKGLTNQIAFWARYVAVAIVFIVFSISLYLLNFNRYPDKSLNESIITQNQPEPGRNKATLTTDDGETIILSEAHSGIIVGNTLAYDDGSSISDTKAQFSTLSTPRGGQYTITLSDGTRVKLNASSSLYYPAQFNESERKVTLIGEAFFEVAHNSKQPFIVEAGKQNLQVLGTVFNINAYVDESQIATTLVEGKVAISMKQLGSEPVILKPGQKSLAKNDQIKVIAVDVEEEIAWKSGKFVFNNSDIYSVMRQIGRWYDVEVEYTSDVSHISFTGSLSRTEPLINVLEDIKLTQSIDLKLEGRRIVVSKK